MSDKKIGLVLEGGGVRAIYTAGVLDVFMEHGISFDGVIGVSAGAVHGCSFVSNQKGRSIRYYKKYCNDPRFMSVWSLITTGCLVGVDFCYHEIPDKLDIYDHDAFLKSNAKFYAVCSDLESGEPEYVHITDMKTQIDYVRASASMPIVSKIVEIDGKKYLDGGCLDGIPVDAFMNMGYEKIVVVQTRDGAYRKKKSKLNWLYKIMYRKYPKFAEKFCNRHNDYNNTLDRITELEKEGSVFAIKPKYPVKLSRTNKSPEKIQAGYDRGRADAEEIIEELKRWLQES